MITKSAWTAISTVAAIAAGTVAVETRYEKQSDADVQFHLVADQAETDRIRAQLDIIEIKIERFREIAATRELTGAEQIDLRALEQERQVLLNRLAQKG